MNRIFSRESWSVRALLSLVLLAMWGASPALAQFRIQIGPQRRPAVTVPQTPAYTFGARRHVDQLAVQMARQANEICLEMHRSYRHNPGFRETYREMYQVLQDAKHIHELVHHQRYHRSRHEGDDHIAHDLHEMDGLVHHIEEDIAHWTPAASHHHHVHGGFHGSSQSLPRLMNNFTETMHHLMADYGVRSQLGTGGEAPPPDADRVAPPPEGVLPSRPRR